MLALILALALLLLSCGGVSKSTNYNPTGIDYKIGSVKTRNTELKFLTATKKNESLKGILLLFPGGSGVCHFGTRSEMQSCGKTESNTVSLNGEIWVSYNFLARNVGRFAERGYLVVLPDMPEDVKSRFNGFNNKTVASAYRVGGDWDGDGSEESNDIIEDMGAILGSLSNSSYNLYLIGTSRGSLAVAYLSGNLTGVSGVVLTASVVSDSFSYCPSGSDFITCTSINSYKSRLLMVHHRDDGCLVSPYTEAKNTFNSLASSDKTFVTVRGGSEVSSNPCKGKTYHGFYGKDKEVVNAILDWIEGKAVPSDI